MPILLSYRAPSAKTAKRSDLKSCDSASSQRFRQKTFFLFLCRPFLAGRPPNKSGRSGVAAGRKRFMVLALQIPGLERTAPTRHQPTNRQGKNDTPEVNKNRRWHRKEKRNQDPTSFSPLRQRCKPELFGEGLWLTGSSAAFLIWRHSEQERAVGLIAGTNWPQAAKEGTNWAVPNSERALSLFQCKPTLHKT